MLTVEQLEAMPPDTVFATGVILDGPTGVNMTDSRKHLRWVAVRGQGIPDWAIYCHWDFHDAEWVKRRGDKVGMEHHIRLLVPCTDEAFKKYRY